MAEELWDKRENSFVEDEVSCERIKNVADVVVGDIVEIRGDFLACEDSGFVQSVQHPGTFFVAEGEPGFQAVAPSVIFVVVELHLIL